MKSQVISIDFLISILIFLVIANLAIFFIQKYGYTPAKDYNLLIDHLIKSITNNLNEISEEKLNQFNITTYEILRDSYGYDFCFYLKKGNVNYYEFCQNSPNENVKSINKNVLINNTIYDLVIVFWERV